MRLPRKLEDDLVQKLCFNLNEHSEEWESTGLLFIHKAGLKIWTNSDFWGHHTICNPDNIGLCWRNKFRLWKAIYDVATASERQVNFTQKVCKAQHELKNPTDFLKSNGSAKIINNLSSAYNDPLIKYRDRFKNEPPPEIVEYVKKQSAGDSVG